ncbi:MAG TPA: DUF4139 domain-containing protein [Candidatus Cloacimonetes bacterium]|nr:DUF4139 domain-containing protein [Candidatus Cloacimonadota bacterium]HEX38164.1 DUF4139 domain-containing protein [Candidatus Cloacimonadota bacterium]
MKKYSLTLIILLSTVARFFAATDMTVYNQNFATVRTNLSIMLEKGLNIYKYDDIPSGIQPTSVHLEPIKASDKVVIHLQNYEYDLANTGKILNKYLDKSVSLIVKAGDMYNGILKSFDYDTIVIENSMSGIHMVNRKEIQTIDLAEMPKNFYTKPTLNWELYSNKTGNTDCKLSYITNGISWNAQYVGILDNDDEKLNLSSWISLENNSGKAFKDVTLKLMAGDVHLAPDYNQYSRELMVFEGEGKGRYEPPVMTEKDFFEYHLYTLENKKVDINNNQQKQLSLFDPVDVKVKKIYRFNADHGNDIAVLINFKNDDKSGLGIPLPMGKVRIFKTQYDDAPEFVGEDNLEHTPKNEEVEIKIGTAFDIKGECVLMESTRPSQKTREEKYECEIRNQKDETVTIEVLKYLGTNWTITSSDIKYTKEDAYTLRFDVQIPAEDKVNFDFTVLYKY